MACPSCQGIERREISLGYFECQSLVTGVRTEMVPDPVREGMHRPLDVPVTTVCAVRYQESHGATSSPSCSCGTYSIGACADCGVPVCGDHSVVLPGRRLCDACAEAERGDLAVAGAFRAARRAELVAREAPRLLSQFLSCAAGEGWPGAEDIYGHRVLTQAQRRKVAEDEHIRATFGWDWGTTPQGWSQVRLERRTRPADTPTPVVARGWNLNRQHDLGERPATSAHDSCSREYGQVYLLTDGEQVALRLAARKWTIAAHLSGGPSAIVGAELIAVLRALAERICVSLGIAEELSDLL